MHTLTNGDARLQQLLLEFIGACISNIKGWRMKKALFLVGDGNTGKSQLKSLVERYKIAVVVVQRYVTNLIGTNISSLKQAACISDVADCHLELRLKRNTKNRGVLRRYSRKYGNVVWEMAYTWPAQRWELKRRTRPEAKI